MIPAATSPRNLERKREAAEGEGTKSEMSTLGYEVAELRKKREDLLRMLSPSYDVRKQFGETSEDAVIANKVATEYYRYFQEALFGAQTRSMGAGDEKERFRRQTCRLFQAVYDHCQEQILCKMTSELEEAMNEFPQTYNPLNELNERQFDRQRAFGLLFLNVSRNELTSEKKPSSDSHQRQATTSQYQCWITSEQPAERQENTTLQDEKIKLQREIDQLKNKQVELLRMYMGTVSQERVMDWIRTKGEKNTLEKMSMELRNLTELPENVTSRGTMSGMNNETEFYTGQQAYGLLLSACNLHLTNDAVQQISNEALKKLDLTEPVYQVQAEHAVQLAWRLLMCVPPLVVCQPIKYSEEWHDHMPAYWTPLSEPFDLVYYQPLLLSSPSGPVKEKGRVGRVESKDPNNCVNSINKGTDSLSEQVDSFVHPEEHSPSEQVNSIVHPEELSTQQLSQEQKEGPPPLLDKATEGSTSNESVYNSKKNRCCSVV